VHDWELERSLEFKVSSFKLALSGLEFQLARAELLSNCFCEPETLNLKPETSS
jgi:hypothetical protein